MDNTNSSQKKSSPSIKYRLFTWEGKTTNEDSYALRFVNLDHYHLVKDNIELFLEILTQVPNSDLLNLLRDWWPSHFPNPNDKQLIHANIRLYQYLTGSREGGSQNKNYIDFSHRVHRLFSWKNFAYLSSPHGKEKEESDLEISIDINERIKKLQYEISSKIELFGGNVVNEICDQYRNSNYEIGPASGIGLTRLKVVYSRLLKYVLEYDTNYIESKSDFNKENYIDMKELMKDHECNILLREELKSKVIPNLKNLLERTHFIFNKILENKLTYSEAVSENDPSFELDLNRSIDSVIHASIKLSKRVKLEKKKKWFYQFIKDAQAYKRSDIEDKIRYLYFFWDEIIDKDPHKQLIAIFLETRINEMISLFALLLFPHIASELQLTKEEEKIYLWFYSHNPLIDNRIPALETLFLQAHFNNRESYELFIDYLIKDKSAVGSSKLQNKYHHMLLEFLKAYTIFKFLYRDYDREEKSKEAYTKVFDKNREIEEYESSESDGSPESDFSTEYEEIENEQYEDLTFRKPRKDFSKSTEKHFTLADTFDIEDELKNVLTDNEFEIVISHVLMKNSQKDIAEEKNISPQAVNKSLERAKRKLKDSKIIQEIYSLRDWGRLTS